MSFYLPKSLKFFKILQSLHVERLLAAFSAKSTFFVHQAACPLSEMPKSAQSALAGISERGDVGWCRRLFCPGRIADVPTLRGNSLPGQGPCKGLPWQSYPPPPDIS